MRAFLLVAFGQFISLTGSNEGILGVVQSVIGIGGVVGGLFISTWGGPRRKVYGVLSGWVVGGAIGLLLYGLGTSLPIWVAASLLFALTTPLVNNSNQSIWQAKVPPEIQGKVFSARRMIAWLVNPVAALIAGVLADRLMEPAFAESGALVPAFGWLVGSGAGAGMAFIMILCGVATLGVMFAAYYTPAIRNAEALLPDHDANQEQKAAPA
jgi:hypothetical protein